ncbi:MAG: helix-turn-helix domain-containing protein [Anaerolineae bacterium]|nr:helix-turn-helix domain-containing protein [Anaerolineae bacterium]
MLKNRGLSAHQQGGTIMTGNRTWQRYSSTYRAKEMKTLAGWIAAGENGSVVGLIGCGRTNLLGFLSYRPEALQNYMPEQAGPVAIIPVDIYNLPANDLSSLYRTILHAFYWVRDRFASTLRETITHIYLENRAEQDPFLPQRALYDLLLEFQNQQTSVVLVLNRFDRFCQTATPQMLNTLRGLRDSFKDTLSYIVGMLQEVIYLPDPAALGDMYELLDSHVCWVGAMTESDARQMLDGIIQAASGSPTKADINAMLALSGHFPILLKAIGQWWLSSSSGMAVSGDWLEQLLEEHNIQYRLERMWNGLTQEEQLVLSEIQDLQVQVEQWRSAQSNTTESLPESVRRSFQGLMAKQSYALARLKAKGLCYQSEAGWFIAGELLAAYVARVEGHVRGKIWLDEKTKNVYQGHEIIQNLTPLEYEILRFLIKNPRIKHTRDDVIDNAWSDDEQREGITPNALQVHIASMRKKIESNPAKPRYLITWHGRPGGYQFFPEGKPL